MANPHPIIDRYRLLLMRERCKAALSNPELSDETRALYKRVLDHAEVALGLDSARARRTRSGPSEQ